MLTRSVVVCMLSGTLVSTMLLGGPLATGVHAETIAVKKSTKAPRMSQNMRTTTLPNRRGGNSFQHERAVHPSSSIREQPSVSLQGRTSGRLGKRLGTFTVRAYTHYHRPGTKPGKTATGTTPAVGRTVAVDPRVIPLGTRIHIEGVGERVAEDTGGLIKGNKLDLFLPSVKECHKFGVQEQEVHLLTK